jgi:hypothetical protein
MGLMSFSNSSETSILQQIFTGTALPWNGNTNLWLALHTADPGEAGTAVTSEATYTGYARVQLVRATDITVSGATASNTSLAQFPVCTAGSSTCTYVSIVTTASGAGTIIVSGALNSSVAVTTGIQPQFSAAALVFTLD